MYFPSMYYITQLTQTSLFRWILWIYTYPLLNIHDITYLQGLWVFPDWHAHLTILMIFQFILCSYTLWRYFDIDLVVRDCPYYLPTPFELGHILTYYGFTYFQIESPITIFIVSIIWECTESVIAILGNRNYWCAGKLFNIKDVVCNAAGILLATAQNNEVPSADLMDDYCMVAIIITLLYSASLNRQWTEFGIHRYYVSSYHSQIRPLFRGWLHCGLFPLMIYLYIYNTTLHRDTIAIYTLQFFTSTNLHMLGFKSITSFHIARSLDWSIIPFTVYYTARLFMSPSYNKVVYFTACIASGINFISLNVQGLIYHTPLRCSVVRFTNLLNLLLYLITCMTVFSELSTPIIIILMILPVLFLYKEPRTPIYWSMHETYHCFAAVLQLYALIF